MNEDKETLVSVFSTNNNALFQVAKTLLNSFKIKFFSTGEFLNPMNAAVYSTEIKVFKKDEAAARKLLSELEPETYQPSSEVVNKILSLHWYWYVVGILILIMAIFFLLTLLK